MTQMHTQMTLPLLQAMSPNSPVSPTPPGVANLAMQSMTGLSVGNPSDKIARLSAPAKLKSS
ncbi:hypothetical protein ACHAWX_006997 [Stephanocyclus meneghinianus]